MTTYKTTVTCIIPTRNRREVVGRSIQSVLKQTYHCLELLIIDDASTDNTYEYLKERYAGFAQISVLNNQTRMGPAATRNRGIELAGGEYVCFLDDDDQWLPQKIERQVRLASKGYDFITMTRALYATGRTASSTYGPKLNEVTLRDLFRRNVIINVSPMVRTSLMRRIGFDPDMWCAEDYDAWIRVLRNNVKTVNLNDPMIVLDHSLGISLNKKRLNKLRGRRQIYHKHKELMFPGEKFLFHLMTLAKVAIPEPRHYQKSAEQMIGINGKL